MSDATRLELFCRDMEHKLNDLAAAFRGLSQEDGAEARRAFFAELFRLQQWFQEQKHTLTAPEDNDREALYELLYKGSMMLRASMEAPQLLNLALDTLLELCGCERGFLAGLDGEGGFTCVAARNFLRETIPEKERDLSRSVIERVRRLQTEVHIGEAAAPDSLLQQSSLVRREGEALLCVPVVFDGHAHAVIYLDRFRAPLTLTNVSLVRHFSIHLAGLLKGSEEFAALRAERTRLLDSLKGRYRFDAVICKSRQMTAVLKTVAKVAPTDAPVLIQGETGTGKDLIARAVHENSKRASGPFIAVDCGALPENLIESELFGHVRGAFTGAQSDKLGLMEAAAGGTLFLDEINNLPKDVQTRLLRVLQSRMLRRIGDTRERPVDFRLLSASGRPVKDLVAEDSFRGDLFYRINTVTLDLPPLRERKEDLYLLAADFLQRYARLYDREHLALDPTVMAALEAHDWPGNVRELEHVVERAVILCDGGRVTLADLPVELGGMQPESEDAAPTTLEHYLNSAKTYFIRKVLQENGGNKAETARRLGINRGHLFQLIKQLDI